MRGAVALASRSDLFVQDVTAKKDGRLIARAFVSTPTILPLQGAIAAALVSPNLEQVIAQTH